MPLTTPPGVRHRLYHTTASTRLLPSMGRQGRERLQAPARRRLVPVRAFTWTSPSQRQAGAHHFGWRLHGYQYGMDQRRWATTPTATRPFLFDHTPPPWRARRTSSREGQPPDAPSCWYSGFGHWPQRGTCGDRQGRCGCQGRWRATSPTSGAEQRRCYHQALVHCLLTAVRNPDLVNPTAETNRRQHM